MSDHEHPAPLRVLAAGRIRLFELDQGEHEPGILSYYMGSFDVDELHIEAGIEFLEGGSHRVTLSALDDSDSEGIASILEVAMERALDGLATRIRFQAEELHRMASLLQKAVR
jgi:hypothetical protein